MTDNIRGYPKKADFGGRVVTFRFMGDGDRDEILRFAAGLPSTDLLFLRRDITHPKVVDAWLAQLKDESIVTVLAVRDDTIVGCAAIVTDPLSWSRHVGELRVLVSPDMRGTGLGRALTQEAFALALSRGLEKLVAQMTPEQQGALSMFSSLGFSPESLMRNHVKDRDGTTHDIILLAHDVARAQAQHEAYGLSEAF